MRRPERCKLLASPVRMSATPVAGYAAPPLPRRTHVTCVVAAGHAVPSRSKRCNGSADRLMRNQEQSVAHPPSYIVPVEGVPAALHRGENALPFVEFEPGVEMQVLQVDIPTGLWVIRMRLQPGATLADAPPWRRGVRVHARRGLEVPRVSRKSISAGSYLYEPAGSIHTLQALPSNSEVTDVLVRDPRPEPEPRRGRQRDADPRRRDWC